MTINDINYFNITDRKLLIYKTPDSAEYDIIIIGSRNPETLESGAISTDPNLLWAIVYKALQHIAEMNASEKESDRYYIKSRERRDEARVKASKVNNNNLTSPIPYDLT